MMNAGGYVFQFLTERLLKIDTPITPSYEISHGKDAR